MTQPADAIWFAHLATMVPSLKPYGTVEHGALAERGGRIVWTGDACDLPSFLRGSATAIHDHTGQWITPALIDCHTHLVFGGNRALEWEARLRGESYESIARAGGGILSTVRATRAASEEELLDFATPRLLRLMRDGVRTVEIKSGYGLTLETELRMLRVARQLGAAHGMRVRTTLLAAHAVPPEFAGRGDAYIDHIIDEIMPAACAEKLVDAVDAFAENIAFSPQQVSRLFDAAGRLGLRVKLHADQLTGGAALAARHGALSADHLEYTTEAGAAAMSEAGTVAVLLPGAYANVGAAQPPPVQLFRRHGVPMALATDCNPGSSPMCSLLTAMNLGCALFRLTPEEALVGVTRHAAKALGLDAELGTLEQGKAAELAVWPISHVREIVYWWNA